MLQNTILKLEEWLAKQINISCLTHGISNFTYDIAYSEYKVGHLMHEMMYSELAMLYIEN